VKVPFAIVAAEERNVLPGTAVGFLVVSPFHRAVAHYCVDEFEVGLESLLVDRRYQRKGYGIAAISSVLDLIRERFPRARRMKLTVNTRNRTAIGIYGRLGFRDTGKFYLGGRSGPQHVFGIALSGSRGSQGVIPDR
jgi:RimJ/RimL family protein N-acetyltransferase